MQDATPSLLLVVPGAAPTPRANHAAAAGAHGRIYIFGGIAAGPPPHPATNFMHSGFQERKRHINIHKFFR